MIRNRNVVALMTLTFFSFVLAQSVRADTVQLTNGDRLTGTISHLENGKLFLKTTYSEKDLVLDLDALCFIETDHDISLQLQTDEIVKGRLKPSKEPGHFDFTGQSFSAENIAFNSLKRINPPVAEPAKLEGSITLGGNHQSGNTERSGVSLAIDAVRKDQKHRFTFGFLYNYAEEDQTVTDRNLFNRLKYDYFFTNRFYGYLATEMLYDKFKDLKLRTTIGPGVGFQVWDDDRKSLAFEAGAAYYNVDRDKGEDDSWITGRTAALFSYKFKRGMKFSESLYFYPSLENSSDYTLRNEASLTSPIAYGWGLKLRSIIDHDSNPDSEDVEKTDYTWILGLNYSFE